MMTHFLKPFFIFIFLFSFLSAEEDFEDISQLEIALSADCQPLTTVADCKRGRACDPAILLVS